jgi:transcription-repair coupling factor (superfamily II helicase)
MAAEQVGLLSPFSLTLPEGMREPPLSKVGDREKWAQTLQRAQKNAREEAQTILRSESMRRLYRAEPLPAPTTEYHMAVDRGFGFTETVDQQAAIDAVFSDLASPIVMRRLLVGDVGFGKTEVAVRAALYVAENKKQTVIVVPSVTLAQQHYKKDFRPRFEHTPYKVALLTSATTPIERKKILRGLAENTISVLIGTQSVLNEGITFKALNLIVVDEEQRLGVEQKETIPRRYPKANILIMTATPIPRTLSQAEVGAYDVSYIKTPPQGRIPVIIKVMKQTPTVVRTAILDELLSDFRIVQDGVEREVLIEFAHGKMARTQLVEKLDRFSKGEFDVLVSTTVIEVGIDVPNANTIIIENANTLGLSSLWQLKGRVGRSTRQGYCYLLYSSELQQKAKARLGALVEFAELGGGFSVSATDLSLRGPGEIFGTQQKGYDYTIAPHLYDKIVEAEIRRMESPEDPDVEVSNYFEFNPVNIEIVGAPDRSLMEVFSDSPDMVQRVHIAFSGATTPEEVAELEAEYFTEEQSMNPNVVNFLVYHLLRTYAQQLGISGVSIKGKNMNFTFSKSIERQVPESVLEGLYTASRTQTLLRKADPWGYKDYGNGSGFTFLASSSQVSRPDMPAQALKFVYDRVKQRGNLRDNFSFAYSATPFERGVARFRPSGHYVSSSLRSRLQPAPAGCGIC